MQEIGHSADGWTIMLRHPSTGRTWLRIQLGSEDHGGGIPIVVEEPMPSVQELLDLAAHSTDAAETAACAWWLVELDPETKEALVTVAELAAAAGDQERAALLVGWGDLLSEMNLRPPLGKSLAAVTKDHDHFRAIAARARRLLRLSNDDPLLRDPRVFTGD
jgi:hypothetical protein